MNTITMTLEGVSPLLMHNVRLSNPLDEWTRKLKEITAKQRKTDQDYYDMARIEYFGGLYHDDAIGVHIPSGNVVAMLLDSARLIRKGPAIERGINVLDLAFPLLYSGPRTPQELHQHGGFTDSRMVSPQGKKGGGKVLRTRPMFRAWGLVATLLYNPEQINPDDLRAIAVQGGKLIGLGDGRKIGHGRFEVRKWE